MEVDGQVTFRKYVLQLDFVYSWVISIFVIL